MPLVDYLRRITGSLNTDALARVRIAIDDARASGELGNDTAAALQTIAGRVAQDIANNPRPEPARAAAAPSTSDRTRYSATVRSCQATSYSDSGPQLRGVLLVEGLGEIPYRISTDGGPRCQAFLRAMDADKDTPPGDFVSRTCDVEMSSITTQSGQQRPTIARWHRPEEAPAKPSERAPRAPRTPASRIQGGGGLDDSMFALMPFVAAVAGVLS